MNYDASISYLPRPVEPNKAKLLGATLFGGMLGMTCYYLPVTKDTFVNAAYRETKKVADDNIKSLNIAADEISKNKLSNESKIFLHQIGVGENINDIMDKCKSLKEEITDPNNVQLMKKKFADNFKSYKKDASLMDTVTAKAMSGIKWNGFKWGMGIGAILGAALHLLISRSE